MKVLDVDQLQAGLTRNIDRMNRLEQEISAIQKTVVELTAMEDALKGEGGQAIRDFYTSCHLPFLQYFLTFKEEFNTVLQQAQQALATLEPVDAGHIVEEFLETDVEKGLKESADITATLTDEANAIMDEVSDIIGLTKLDDTLVQESIADARKKRNDTVDALHTFDSTQTSQLTPIETSIQSMKEWVQNIEGLFKEGLTDVGFPSDKWSGIAGNSEIVMKLSAMGMETGIEPQEPLVCERPVETDVKEDRAWYEVVGDVIVGVFEGAGKAIADIFTGLYDMLASLFDDPKAFFGGLATAILNPIDTVTQMWGTVEVAWKRDVINGDARSRAAFFSYTAVSLFGVKGLDKLGKMGKAAVTTKKPDNSLPYNAMQTDKLKDTVKSNVTTIIQEKTKQASDFWKSSYAKKAINETIQAVKNADAITKVKNTLDPANIKAAATKAYEDVIKSPIAKTQAALKEQKEQFLDRPLPNFGLVPEALGPATNMTVREGIEAAKNTMVQIVGNKDGDGERTKEKDGHKFKNIGGYFAHINEIGKRDDLTSAEKFKQIHEAYDALEVKGDVTVVSDMRFLTPHGFVNGRMDIDWPDKMGFEEGSVQAIDKNNPLPERWDRVGGKGGENFTTLPDNNIPFTYDQRAIPYLENPSARHVGVFNNEAYFAAIDAIKNGNLEELNQIVIANGKPPISDIDFDRFKASYDDYQDRMKIVFESIDATYGLKGAAAPWHRSTTGEKLMNGGAEQIVTPLNAETLEMIGVIPKY